MTPEQKKEDISKAYLQAVAARCGFAVGIWSQDHGGIDVTIGAAGPVGRGTFARPKLDVQLKCTAQQELLHDDFLSWTLDRTHYDALRRDALDPHLLVVLLLDADETRWIEHGADALILRRCAWWVTMTGMPPKDTTSVTVRLPRAQVFSPDQLMALLEKLSAEGRLW